MQFLSGNYKRIFRTRQNCRQGEGFWQRNNVGHKNNLGHFLCISICLGMDGGGCPGILVCMVVWNSENEITRCLDWPSQRVVPHTPSKPIPVSLPVKVDVASDHSKMPFRNRRRSSRQFARNASPLDVVLHVCQSGNETPGVAWGSRQLSPRSRPGTRWLSSSGSRSPWCGALSACEVLRCIPFPALPSSLIWSSQVC